MFLIIMKQALNSALKSSCQALVENHKLINDSSFQVEILSILKFPTRDIPVVKETPISDSDKKTQ